MKKFSKICFFIATSLFFTSCNEAKQVSLEIKETQISATATTKTETTPKIEVTETEKVPEPTPEPTPAPTQEAKPIDFKVVKPNEVGEIMVVMYHGIVEGEPPSSYQRNINDFKNDLQTMYDQGYRLIKMQDLIDNNISVEAGFTPIVLSFDDGISTSFSLEEKDGKLVPKKDSAVDILNEFNSLHPDFGKAAIFYINASANPFEGAGTLKERFEYLVDNGYEIGNHTYDHPNLSKLSANEIQEEIAKVHQMVLDELPGNQITSLSYPFGIRPTEDLRSFALEGKFENTNYKYSIAVREGQSGDSASPNNIKFNPLNIPRVRGSNNENTDLGWSFNFYKENPSSKYISDGNPNVISLPEQKVSVLNKESLNGKELNVYLLD